MAKNVGIKESYFNKAKQTQTWSGIPIKAVYGPDDIKGIDYERDLGAPGNYPFARGVYADMFRGRLWSRRLITGCSTPALTNERLKYLLSRGETAINIICDQPTQIYLDPDHPMAEGTVGRSGVPICTMNDVFTIMDGIPLDECSTMLTSHTPITFPSYLLLAEKTGVPWSELRGTGAAVRVPTLANPVFMYGGREWWHSLPIDLGQFVAETEWVHKNVPRWNSTYYNAYNIRESGVNAAQEVAFIFAQVFEVLKLVHERGCDMDFFASKVNFTFSVMIDLFEEVAKFRAARRIYARTLKERLGVKDPKSLRMKMHVNTGGILMERPQAIINIARGAYAGLAAVLGGCQSLQICSYDEAIAIPTEEAAAIALRTEQILAFETGVTNVADPLGGSYYVEWLTDKMEHEIQKILDEIEGMGGLTAAINKGWIDQQLEKAWLTHQQELNSKERIVVGVNEFTVPEEADAVVPVYHHGVDQELVQRYIDEVKELKRTRSQQRVQKALEDYWRLAEKGGQNLIPAAMECCKAYATTAELRGVYRMAMGLSYDLYGMVEYPFKSRARRKVSSSGTIAAAARQGKDVVKSGRG